MKDLKGLYHELKLRSFEKFKDYEDPNWKKIDLKNRSYVIIIVTNIHVRF